MNTIAEMLNAAPGTNLTPELTRALGAEAVLKRAAANTHGEAITPELEAAIAVAA